MLVDTALGDWNIYSSCGVQQNSLTRVQFRWLLPVGHLLIDSAVLVLWLWHTYALLDHKAAYAPSRAAVITVLFLQESGSVSWDPRFISPSDEFMFLTCGSLPAAIVSSTARPLAHIQTRGKLWDPGWFLIHEAVAFPLWLLIGMWLDSGRLRIRKVMLTYLAARSGFAVFLMVPGSARLGLSLEMLFWLGLGSYAILLGLRWCFRRLVRSRLQSPQG